MPPSDLYNQYNVYGAGMTPHYSLYTPGAKTWFVAPSGYTAVGGLAASDGNLGTSPQEPLATIGQALTNYSGESSGGGRGDRIVLLPGTHTLTANVAISSLTDGALVSYIPGMAFVNGAFQITIDSNAWEIAGIHFNNNVNETGMITIAQTTATERVWIHHCTFEGSDSSNTNGDGVIVGEGTSGTEATHVRIEHCHFMDFDGAAITTFGGTHIVKNTISMADGDLGVEIGDYGAASAVGNRDIIYIIDNMFSGATDAGDEVGITLSAAEANYPLFVAYGNGFGSASSSAVTADKHPEGVLINYAGDVSTNGPITVAG